MQIKLPLEIYYSKNKKFILNLNNYRNAHYRVLATAKKLYSENLQASLKGIKPFTEPVVLEYTYFAKSNRRLDVSNPCSIIDKFTCDALVKAGVLADDSYNEIDKVIYKFGGVDKSDARCELVITPKKYYSLVTDIVAQGDADI